jgi:phosphate:Na+ symporter
MTKLGTLMQAVVSGRIRRSILFAVRKPVYGIGTGIAATILFQSSSATTSIAVGMVSAGLISFYHSLGIILGADIGTTLTVQLVVWKVTEISPLLLLSGIIVWLGGTERIKPFGEAIFYFGLIFFGLNLITQASVPFKDNETVIRFFREASHPLLGLSVGLIFTALVHASSIPVSILIILASQGFMTIESAFPVVLGANIGTTVTALTGSIVGNVDGRRAAIAHLLSKCWGVAVALLLMTPLTALLKALSSSVPQQIALGHFVYNLLIVLMFLPLLKPFERLVTRLVPGSADTIALWPEFLDRSCLENTEMALHCVQQELIREINLSRRMLTKSLELISDFRETTKRDVMYIEMVVDNLQIEITDYLWNVSCKELDPHLSQRLFAYSSTVYDIERIADRATNLVELAESKHKREAFFSDAAHIELRQIGALVLKSVDDVTLLLQRPVKERITAVLHRKIEVGRLVRQAVTQHLERFYRRVCRAEAGPIFVDMLVNLERISEHCKLIADHADGLKEA